MSGAHDAATQAAMAREKAYVDALTQFRTEATTAQDAAFQKEAVAMDRAIAYSQTYGVTIDDANKALGQTGRGGRAGGHAHGAGDAGRRPGGRAVDGARDAVGRRDGQAGAALSGDGPREQDAGGTGAFFTPFEIGQNYEESARKMREAADRRRLYETNMGARPAVDAQQHA